MKVHQSHSSCFGSRHRGLQKLECPTHDVQRTISNVRCPTYNVKSTLMSNVPVRCRTSDVHRTMSNVRCPTYDVQRSMSGRVMSGRIRVVPCQVRSVSSRASVVPCQVGPVSMLAIETADPLRRPIGEERTQLIHENSDAAHEAFISLD